MRADRLIAVLLLLQRHGRVTTNQVAEALEISPRTARRDLEALGLAGVPVYSTAGRGGGWQLVGGARTDLTGLSAPEVRALFLAAGSVPGQPEAVTSALHKLLHAVPEPFRREAAAASEAVFVDRAGWWGTEAPPPPLLDVVQDALVVGRQLEITYRDRVGSPSVRRVHPLGLVTKGGHWYLVSDTARGRRTFRVDRMAAATVTDDPADRPDDFDLRAAWRSITETLTEQAPRHVVIAEVEGWTIPILRRQFGRRLVTVGAPDVHHRHRVEIHAASLQAAAGLLAGFGGAAHVLDPPELRSDLARIGAELVAQYRDAPRGDRQPGRPATAAAAPTGSASGDADHR
jgi:predicted DNA-binding transcriptional regulator YafY